MYTPPTHGLFTAQQEDTGHVRHDRHCMPDAFTEENPHRRRRDLGDCRSLPLGASSVVRQCGAAPPRGTAVQRSVRSPDDLVDRDRGARRSTGNLTNSDRAQLARAPRGARAGAEDRAVAIDESRRQPAHHRRASITGETRFRGVADDSSPPSSRATFRRAPGVLPDDRVAIAERACHELAGEGRRPEPERTAVHAGP